MIDYSLEKEQAGSNEDSKELEVSHDFGDEAKATPIEYSKLPKEIQAELDDFAAALLDPDGGQIFVTGYPMAGKSFIIEQLYFNLDRYVHDTELKSVDFIRVSNEQAALVESQLGRKWLGYVNLVGNLLKLDRKQMVFVTESTAAAIGLSNLGVKVIYELSIATFVQLHRSEVSGVVKQWSSWDTVDVNGVFLKPTTLTNVLANNLLDKLNLHYPKIELEKKHIQMFINLSVRRSQLEIPEELLEDYMEKGAVMVPPGVWARAVSRLASIMAFNSDIRNNKGSVVLSKAMNKVYRDFEENFEEFSEMFFESSAMGSGGVPEGIEDVIQQILSSALPGVKVVALNKNSPALQAVDPALSQLSFNSIATLGERLSKEVLGQDDAVKAVVNAMKIPAAGLNASTKPLRSMLFLGPTGVGKTQMAITLAQELMDSPMPVKRFDMSEYGHEHESAKLLGAPPGYVGFDEGGALTNYVKSNPQSIIILDEIEKAHPKIWDSFLQVLDAGRMTDNKDNTFDFTKTIIIMTSNLGAQELARPNTGFSNLSSAGELEKRKNDAQRIVKRAVEENFKPEMVNRIDDQIIFDSLPKSIVRDVVAKEVNAIIERIKDKGYSLNVPTSDILDRLAELSDVSKYGAREIQRVVSRVISTVIADTVLNNNENKELTLSLDKNKEITINAK